MNAVHDALHALIEAVGNDNARDGDILSRRTIQAADAARLALSRYDIAEEERWLAAEETWQFTASGTKFYPVWLARHGMTCPMEQLIDMIKLEDIASGLSKICRFNGQCSRFYTVAEHSVHVALMVQQNLAPHALLHDAAEAYLGDMIRPIKQLLPDFVALETALVDVIYRRFGLAAPAPAAVWLADNAVLAHEILVNCTIPQGVTLQTMGLKAPLNFKSEFHYFPPDEAKAFFLDAARALLPFDSGSAFASDAARHVLDGNAATPDGCALQAGARPLNIGGDL